MSLAELTAAVEAAEAADVNSVEHGYFLDRATLGAAFGPGGQDGFARKEGAQAWLLGRAGRPPHDPLFMARPRRWRSF